MNGNTGSGHGRHQSRERHRSKRSVGAVADGRGDAVPADRSCNVRQVHEEPIEAGQRAGDPIVVAALTLGWEMADLYAAREVDGPIPELPETLPGVGRLTSRQTVHATLLRIRTLLRQALGPAVADTIPLPSSQILGA